MATKTVTVCDRCATAPRQVYEIVGTLVIDGKLVVSKKARTCRRCQKRALNFITKAMETPVADGQAPLDTNGESETDTNDAD